VKTGIQTLFLSIENPGFLLEFIPVKTGAGMTVVGLFASSLNIYQISDVKFQI